MEWPVEPLRPHKPRWSIFDRPIVAGKLEAVVFVSQSELQNYIVMPRAVRQTEPLHCSAAPVKSCYGDFNER
jgi:hypothetical protein